MNLRDSPMLKAFCLLRLLFFRMLKRVHSETESVPSLFYFMFNLTVKTSSRPYYYYYYYYIERQKKTFLILTNKGDLLLK